MFIEERRQKIMELIREQGRVEVLDLGAFFGVSEDSIRRDLRLLEKKGWITRTYGGAVLPDQVIGSVPQYALRKNIKEEGKNKIAALAVSFVQDHDVLLLDGATTVAAIVPYLAKFSGLTVITNSVAVAYELLTLPSDIKLVMIGGVVQRELANTVSAESIEYIRRLHVDKLFFGPCGLSPRWGLTSSSLEEAKVNESMLEAANQVFILADNSKFGHRSLIHIADIKPDFTIITDIGLSEQLREEFSELIEAGLEVICSDEVEK